MRLQGFNVAPPSDFEVVVDFRIIRKSGVSPEDIINSIK